MFKGRTKYLPLAAFFAALILCLAPVHAAWLTWDTAAATNPVAGGDGTWDFNVTDNWTIDNGANKINWTPNDGTNVGLFTVGTGTITVGGLSLIHI